MAEYFPILVFFVIGLVLCFIILGLAFVFGPSKPDAEKRSAYECGFDPFDDARGRFDIRFYLVAILFIIFDLEIAFFSVGANSKTVEYVRILYNDGISNHLDRRFRIRMAKRCFGLGVN